MKTPTISVVIPVYNGAAYVEKAIESVLAQTFKDYELVVMNDGSTDNSKKKILKYKDKLKYYHQKNQGGAAARNNAVPKTKGKYLAFLDSDDLWDPQKLEKCYAALQKNPEAAMVCSTYTLIRLDGSVVIPHVRLPILENFYPNLMLRNFLSPQGSVIKREVFLEFGGYCGETNLYEDWPLWNRISKNYKILWINEPLFQYRGTKTNKYSDQEIALRLARQRKVLEIAFREDPSLGKWFQARCFANVSMDISRACFYRKQFIIALKLAIQSIVTMPFQTAAYIFFPAAILYKIFRSGIKSRRPHEKH